MYLIKWKDDNENKSFVAEGWIEQIVMVEKLEEKGLKYTCELI